MTTNVFGMASVEFLGHAFDEKGILMSSAIIIVIHDLQEHVCEITKEFRGIISGFCIWPINLFHALNLSKRYTSESFQLIEAARNAFSKDLFAKAA